MINEISKSIGVKYYVFLQPTMGLDTNQIPKNKGSEDYKIFQKMNDFSKKQINILYSDLKKQCDSLPFCHDISDIATPDGDFYHDPRHHNEKGNKVIAEEIFKIILKDEKN